MGFNSRRNIGDEFDDVPDNREDNREEQRYAHSDENVERHVSGLDDPDEDGGGRHKGDWKRVLKLGVPVIILSVAILFYFAWDIVKEFQGSSGGISSRQPQNIRTGDAEYMKLLEDLRARDERLQLLEKEREQDTLDMDKRLKEILDEVARNKDAEAKLAEANRRMSEMTEEQKRTAALLADIQARLVARDAEREPASAYPEEPPSGSRGESISFNAVAKHNEKIARIEAEMAERANTPPPFTVARGIKTGEFIPGILRTALISSPALEHFKAVIETVAPFEVAPGQWLPAGTLFLGKAVSDLENTRRMHLTLDEMRVGHVTIPVSGMALQNGNPGLVSKYVDPLNSAAWSMLLPNILAAAADASQDMVTKTNRMTGEEYETPEFSTRNVALQGLGNSMRLQSQVMYEVQARKKPVIIVRRGIPVDIQVLETIPLETMLEAGVLTDGR